MTRIAYVEKRFSNYQFVARGYIANKQTEYKRLGTIVNDARLAGLLDRDYIVDHTWNLRGLAHWDGPEPVVQSAAYGHRTERWADQSHRAEVWIEKDTLVGVISGVCERNDVNCFSCRGYTSQSELWGAAQRMIRYERAGQKPVIIHLGDHDPSGVDMTRDIEDRPPNPAKLTDSRAGGCIREHGQLIEDEIWAWPDADLRDQETRVMERDRTLLRGVADRRDEVSAPVGGDGW
ncbi:hypothetical protein ACWEQC_08700 [Streptomyces shenzhenensis]